MNKIFTYGLIATLVGGIAVVISTMGVNDAGYRTVLQSPSGDMSVKFEAGWYFAPLAKTTVYPDVMTFDFSAEDGTCSFNNENGIVDGIKVRYQDGGEGTVCGIMRVALPTNDTDMLAVHKAYINSRGIHTKLLNQSTRKSVNLTAALMSSEEAYATKRSEFLQMAEEQVERGAFRTRLVEKTIEAGLDENGDVEYQEKKVPEPIMNEDGTYLAEGSEIETYGFNVQQFDINAWDFEQKTLNQISTKREAEMATVTAKANADRAYYEQIQAEAEGKKKVTEKEYEELQKATREIVNADKEQQIAVIQAKQAVLVQEQAVERAKQEVLEQQQLKLAAVEEGQKIKTLADAEAYAKEAIIEADNALQAKLDAEVQIQAEWAKAYQNRKVPANVTILGNDGSGTTPTGGDTEVLNFLRLKTAEAANNLSYDRKVNNSN